MKFFRSRLGFLLQVVSEPNTGRARRRKGKLRLLGIAAILFTIASLPSTTVAASSISLSRGSVAFGYAVVGSTKEQSIVLTNHGPASVTIHRVTVSGTNFSESGFALPLTIPAGHAISLIVHFAPKTVGNFEEKITIESNASNPLITIMSTGLGIARISTDSPTTYFLGVAVGSKAQHTISLTNNAETSVRISKVAVSGVGFSQTGLGAVTIAPHQKISFTEYFAPKAVAEIKGQITIYAGASVPVVTIASIGVSMQQLSVSSAIAFGEVAVGSKAQHTVTVTNHGTSGVRISRYIVEGAAFSETGLVAPVVIAARATKTFTVNFVPRVPGEVRGAISITSNASDPTLSVALSGIGGAASALHLEATPASAAFQKVAMGDTNSQPIKLSNTSGKAIVISHAVVSGKGFKTAGLAESLTIPAGASVTFNVMFTATVAGPATGALSLVSNAANSPLTVPLNGTAIAASLLLGASPATMNFQSVVLGADSLQDVTLTNRGNSKLIISSVRVAGSEFSESGSVSGVVLEPAQSTAVKVAFRPTIAGSAAGSVVVASNATNSPTAIALSGIAVAKASRRVDLSWRASSSPEILGYHVYRGIVSGGPYTKLTSATVPATSYIDSAVETGQTYYYVVTSIDSAGIESTDSNQASAAIPAP
jgi:Abnormal spindle-like microcephaly-assoc'd, ASPM-SPD-2-Hydin/Transmembrane protein 131-like N-terminal